MTAGSPEEIRNALTVGVAVGGASILYSNGASSACAVPYSWYNYMNYCYNWCAPYYYAGGCYSGFSFWLGWSWSWGWGSASFGFGSPYWWSYPASYCAPYWNCAPGGYYPNYWYYPSYASYPVYYSEPVYYPVPVSEPIVVEVPVYQQPAPAQAPREDAAPAPEQRAPAASGKTPVVTSSKLADRYVSLGDVYFQLGRYDRALEAYEKAASFEPNDPSLQFIVCDALFANGRFSDTARAIRRALVLDPGLVESRADKRGFYARTGDFDAQIRVLEGWLVNHPDSADGWLVLGYNRYFRHELAAAREAFEKARDLASAEDRVAADLFLAAAEVRLAEPQTSKPSGR